MARQDERLQVLQDTAKPRIKGRIISDSGDYVTVEGNGCTVDIPLKHVQGRREIGKEQFELVLSDDAELVISMLVSAKRGFVSDNVFGSLTDGGVLADNCNCNCNGGNCNCNCSGGGGGGGSVQAIEPIQPFRRPFEGGARR